MSDAAAAIARSWSPQPWLFLLLALVGAVYLRGWRSLHRRRPRDFNRWRPAAFISGLAVLYVAVASPLDAFGGLLLQVHMWQHLLLMLVVPPLLLLSWPAIPMLRGLPATIRRHWIGPFLAEPTLRRAFAALTHPVTCWLAFVLCFWIWHLPALYELALVSPRWHRFEHALFVATGLLFWWPVVQPYPFRAQWPRWAMVPYLLAGSLQNTVFSAIFCFSDRVFYPIYEQVPRVTGMSALADQAVAGAVMWVPGSIIMLIPAGWIMRSLMMSPQVFARRAARTVALPVLPARRREDVFDLLRVGGIGTLLKSRRFRMGLRIMMLLLAAAIVIDGLRGPQMPSMNLAGVLPWTYWRGLAVIALLAGGNFFCMVCPFMAPRALGRRFLPAGKPWPQALQSKWLAVVLLVAYLAAYEVFDLWASPWWTAWIALGYFAAAFAIDGVFRGASFCKYVCPIGQFHFVSSMISPLQVRVRDMETCRSCRTHDCIKGRDNLPGCETHLFQPKKVGNLDCTFCLDCVSACPHDNVGILASVPGPDLIDDRPRSSIGSLSGRPDVAALIIVLVFGAFANAAGMVGPVVQWQDAAAHALGWPRQAVTVALLLASLLLIPAVLACNAALLSWVAAPATMRWTEVLARFAPTLIPIGFAMWFSHMFFHLVTGAATFVPVAQQFFGAANPDWTLAHAMTAPDWLIPMEITALGLGLVASIITIWLAARRLTARMGETLTAAGPWAVLATGLYLAGIWIILQPMEMRGTMAMTAMAP